MNENVLNKYVGKRVKITLSDGKVNSGEFGYHPFTSLYYIDKGSKDPDWYSVDDITKIERL